MLRRLGKEILLPFPESCPNRLSVFPSALKLPQLFKDQEKRVPGAMCVGDTDPLGEACPMKVILGNRKDLGDTV